MAARLSFVSAAADRELELIRNTIVDFQEVSGLGDVIAVLRTSARQGIRTELLDLIGHSRSGGFLVLGDWTIDDTAQTAASFVVLLRPLLEQLGVRTIRLLGCGTAETPRCRAALRSIARASRCAVLGTTRTIGWRDYTAGGYWATNALSAADALPL